MIRYAIHNQTIDLLRRTNDEHLQLTKREKDYVLSLVLSNGAVNS